MTKARGPERMADISPASLASLQLCSLEAEKDSLCSESETQTEPLPALPLPSHHPRGHRRRAAGHMHSRQEGPVPSGVFLISPATPLGEDRPHTQALLSLQIGVMRP